MPVIRVIKNENYTQMSNFHLRDKHLSLRAVGLLSKMLSLPPDWDYTVAGLSAICKEGKDAIRAALNELEDAGYMTRYQTHSDTGKFDRNEYLIREEPSPLSGFPSTVSPSTVFPLTENPTQINKDLNNNLDINPPISPQGGASAPDKPRRVRSIPKHEPEMFARLWKKYPRGEDKASAIREWDRLKPDRELMMTMSAALERDMNSDEWRRGIGIPYLCRWLSKRRWEDEDHSLPVPDLAPVSQNIEIPKDVDIWT